MDERTATNPAELSEELIARGRRKIFPCKLLRPGSRRPCNATFCRASALTRHKDKIHPGGASTTFISCNPDAARRRSIFTASLNSAQGVDIATNACRPFPESYPANGHIVLRPSPIGISSNVRQAVANASNSSPSPFFEAPGQTHPHAVNPPTTTSACGTLRCAHREGLHVSPQDVQSPMYDGGYASAGPPTSSQPVITCQSNNSPAVTPKKVMPAFDCRVSKQVPDQPKALLWLYLAAKLHFFADYEALLAAWGLTLRHSGTCLLIPEAWRFANPLHLMALFSVDSVPRPDSPRAWFSYADHATSLARAKVFFEKLQRKGEDLDVFLGYPGLPAMDASHLCHQEHCVIHLVYEPAHINQDRNNCLERAKFLRSQNLPVPEGCTAHDPPCMMQRAALTALEACYHQFAVLRKAYGLPPHHEILRPQRYPYRTFEYRIPGQYSSIRVEAAHLVTKLPGDADHLPDFTCTYCTPHFQTFASIIGLWSHIVNRHQEVDNSVRLEKIKQTAVVWTDYWSNFSKGGKRNYPTLAKVEEAQGEGFSWTHVMSWRLRWA
ncbi:MAG: hypothetical protein Q9226_005533 [Calogaya cf. arnoldii]